jgi:transposase
VANADEYLKKNEAEGSSFFYKYSSVRDLLIWCRAGGRQILDPLRDRPGARFLARRVFTQTELLTGPALFGQRIQPEANSPGPHNQRYIKALTSRRRFLVARRSAERCQLKQADFEDIRAMIRRALARLETDIKALDARIAALIEADAAWRNRARRLTSLPGIGTLTSAVLIAQLPELGRVSRGEIVALVGVAPFARESGRWRGKRICRGGRKDLRNAVYMAALSATRAKNTPFSALYRRLITAGKPPKLAITAVMRKMVVTLNAMERTQKVYAK